MIRVNPDEPIPTWLWSSDTPTEFVLLDQGGRLVGRLRFRVCQKCRTGRILDVWIQDSRQRQGLGRELIHSLLAQCPGYRWSTTLQTRDGRAFFSVMAQETTVALPHSGPLCRHLMGWLQRTRQHLLHR
ncbi:GNAT family N-acetyltransferase [Streptomyces sp. NPDC002817]